MIWQCDAQCKSWLRKHAACSKKYFFPVTKDIIATFLEHFEETLYQINWFCDKVVIDNR